MKLLGGFRCLSLVFGEVMDLTTSVKRENDPKKGYS